MIAIRMHYFIKINIAQRLLDKITVERVLLIRLCFVYHVLNKDLYLNLKRVTLLQIHM